MKKTRLITLALTMVLSMSFTSVTAFAGGGDEIAEPTPEVAVATEETAPVAPAPLTPDGNLTLVDDIDGEQANGKQFVTVQSKAGNYFYLVIDRDGDKENVYFLNLVDEADLLALIEEPPVEETPEPTPPPVEETPEEAPEEPVEEKGSSMGMVALFLIVALAGGGAYYYFKILKPKQDNKGSTNLEEYDFDDEDDEELILDEISEDESYNEDSENE